jgi:hypothetical protein
LTITYREYLKKAEQYNKIIFMVKLLRAHGGCLGARRR